MTKEDCLLSILICADTRITLKACGHRPMAEVHGGRDTGRVAHERRGDELFIVFEDRTVTVKIGTASS